MAAKIYEIFPIFCYNCKILKSLFIMMQNDISTLKLDLKILGTSVVRANMLEKHQNVKKSQLKFLTKKHNTAN